MLSMPGYVDAIRREINHPHPRQPQHASHAHLPIKYGNQPQLATEIDDSEPLSPDDPIQLARIIGKLLYYARAVDSTLCVALSALAAEQNKPTQRTKRKILHLLDYCATHPNAKPPFHASHMILHMHSDAGYNNKTRGRSQSVGHLFLGTRPKPGITQAHNGAILNPTNIIKHVAPSAADAEIGVTFINCREAIPIRMTLQEMGYPQPPTIVTLDSTTAVGFANKNIPQRRTKPIDMRYYWLQDQDAQQKFKFEWKEAAENRADYFSKHHPPAHHRAIRQQYVNSCSCITGTRYDYAATTGRHIPLRGCANPIAIQWHNAGTPVTTRHTSQLPRAAGKLIAVTTHQDHQTVNSLFTIE